jgi:GT2 family glycosyltransferase
MTSPPLVSVVIVGYRRPELLKRTVTSFLATNTYANIEMILSDDGSPPEELRRMKELPFDRVVESRRNTGLGANTNRGLGAARGEFVLQLQDDWECCGPGGFIESSIEVAREWPELGFLRLRTPQEELTYSVRHSTGGRVVRVYDAPQPVADQFVYTDTPHFKSRSAIERLGPYLESRSMARTEIDMRDRFNRQTAVRAAFIEGSHAFEHIGAGSSFNRPLPMARVGMFLDRIPAVRWLAAGYRWVRAR